MRGWPRTASFSVVAALGLATAVAGAVLLTGALTGKRGPGAARLIGEMPVTAMNQTVAPANNSPLMAAHPTDPRFVVMANRLDAPDFSCALQVSGNAGRSWLTVEPVPKLPPGAEKCYAPEVAFDAVGRLYYLFVGLHGGGNEPMGAFIASSDDQGRTFSRPRRVLGPRNFAVRMAVDQSHGDRGRIHLVWLQATSDTPLGGLGPPPNPILAAFSDDGGRTFSSPVRVNDPTRQRVVAPALTLGPDGTVHVAYYDLKEDAVDYQGLEGPRWDGKWSIVVTNSPDAGGRFGDSVEAEAAVVPPERVMLIYTMPPPSLVVHGRRSCVAWTDGRHGDPDVFVRCSEDTGRHWSAAKRVNDDPKGNGIHQYMPRLSLSPEGRLDAVFYDRRLDRLNIGNDVYYTYSSDGGRRFTRNLKLSEDGSDSRIGQQYTVASAKGLVEFGSRLGLLSFESRALAAWADTRYSQPGTTGQDIFAARIGLEGDPDDAWRPAMSGVLLTAGLITTGVASAKYRRRSRGQRRTRRDAELIAETVGAG